MHLLRDEVVGATLTPYMLEAELLAPAKPTKKAFGKASRVSGDLPAGERTYHIFYLLKTALKALSKEVLAPFGLSSPLKVDFPSTPFWDRLAREKNWQELAGASEWLIGSF